MTSIAHPTIEASDNTATPATSAADSHDSNPATLPLPKFIERRTEGLFVRPAQAMIDNQFARFVERMFGEGFMFADLDYSNFSRLLYDDINPADTTPALRIATELRAFDEARRALYKALKIAPDGSTAEYMFEPVSLPNPEQPDETIPTQLVFDEFVVHLWLNGVRFGIAEKAVRQQITKGEIGRIEVAHAHEPHVGEDAHVVEECDSLHRDNKPKTLANGQVDLGQFQNRYPQVTKGTALLRKVPRKLGTPGFKVTGEPVTPEPPADFELAPLAGLGTVVERRANGETIVASMDGFLSLDAKSNQISITEKIVSHDGVSLRTTGNLSLRGEDYEEHGEVQEKRVVEGNNMDFHADVYGIVVSHGGTIHLYANLSGGKASSPNGRINIDARASASVIEAPEGEVHIKYAEGCTIHAGRVYIEHAVLCQIIGDSVEIAHSEGCAIGGKTISIGKAGARKDVETIVSLFTPDFSELDEQCAELEKQRAETVLHLEQHHARITELQQQPALASFMALQGKIKRGEIQLNAAQQEGLKRAGAQITPALQQLKALGDAHLQLQKVLDAQAQKQAVYDEQRHRACEGIQIRIQAIESDTIVRTTPLTGFDTLLGDALQAQLVALRSTGEPKDRLFSGDKGRFGWNYGSGEIVDEGWVE